MQKILPMFMTFKYYLCTLSAVSAFGRELLNECSLACPLIGLSAKTLCRCVILTKEFQLFVTKQFNGNRQNSIQIEIGMQAALSYLNI